MTRDYHIRRADPQLDADRITSLAKQAFDPSDYKGFQIQFKSFSETYEKNKSQLSWSLDEVVDRTALVTQDMFVIEHEGRIIGFSGIEVPMYEGDINAIGWLNWTAVDQEYQGNGLGKQLLGYIMAEAKSHGIANFGIKTTPHYPAAAKLYERAGFKEHGRLPHYYGPGVDCIIYFTNGLGASMPDTKDWYKEDQ